MKITVIGIGYVGLSNAILLAQNNEVIAVDIDQNKVDLVNNKKSPLVDKEIEEYLATFPLNLKATTDLASSVKDSDFVIISAPTNYDENKNFFDTSIVENCIEQVISVNENATIVIKSTVPVGFTENMLKKHKNAKILFSPEFLREGKALFDNLYPSRIIVGSNFDESAKIFADLLLFGAIKKDTEVLITKPTEAESIKLFSNTYLALRVAFFNELDTYAEVCGLNTKDIIDGVGLDPRIGNYYNNPSFGYGGYCLPKDTKQILANYKDVPNNIIGAIVSANDTRKNFIATQILKKSPKTVGVYRLTMKSGSDNFRESSISAVIKILQKENVNVVIFEPTLSVTSYNDIPVVSDIENFKTLSDVIIANRYEEELSDVKTKLYTRDIYFKD